MVSQQLGNPEHIDDDFSQSYAVWVTNAPDHITNSMWLLFPQWHLTVQLTNGTYISWNGHECAHCSSVPREYDGFEILSLFTAPSRDLCEYAMKINSTTTMTAMEAVSAKTKTMERVTKIGRKRNPPKWISGQEFELHRVHSRTPKQLKSNGDRAEDMETLKLRQNNKHKCNNNITTRSVNSAMILRHVGESKYF